MIGPTAEEYWSIQFDITTEDLKRIAGRLEHAGTPQDLKAIALPLLKERYEPFLREIIYLDPEVAEIKLDELHCTQTWRGSGISPTSCLLSTGHPCKRSTPTCFKAHWPPWMKSCRLSMKTR